jgi:hypothetical protein
MKKKEIRIKIKWRESRKREKIRVRKRVRKISIEEWKKDKRRVKVWQRD